MEHHAPRTKRINAHAATPRREWSKTISRTSHHWIAHGRSSLEYSCIWPDQISSDSTSSATWLHLRTRKRRVSNDSWLSEPLRLRSEEWVMLPNATYQTACWNLIRSTVQWEVALHGWLAHGIIIGLRCSCCLWHDIHRLHYRWLHYWRLLDVRGWLIASEHLFGDKFTERFYLRGFRLPRSPREIT